MALKKCPRCELNYCRKNQNYCDICLRELAHKGIVSEDDEDTGVAICSECGENPAALGSELCIDCLKEQKRQQDLENIEDPENEDYCDLEEEEF